MGVIRLRCRAFVLIEPRVQALVTSSSKRVIAFIRFRNLSEPVMTYKLHKELVSAASKYVCCSLNWLVLVS